MKCLPQTIKTSFLFLTKIREAFKNDSNFQDVKVTQLRWGAYVPLFRISLSSVKLPAPDTETK